MNFKNFDKKQWGYFVVSCVCVIFGILFCVFSGTLVETLRTVLSVAVLIYGAFYLFSYSVISFDNRDMSTLLKAVVSIAIGLFVIFIPSFFVMAIAGVVALLGLAKVLFVSKIKKQENVIAKDRLVIGISEMVVGLALVVLCNLNISTVFVTVYLGVTLILEGLLGFVFLFAHKNAEEIIIGGALKQQKEDLEEVESKTE